MNPLRFGWQGITTLVAGVGVAAGVGYGMATLVLDPGSNPGGVEESRVPQQSSGERELVIRAIGDSVTAGFGFRKADGARLSGGEVFDCFQGDAGSDDCQDPDGVAYPAVFWRSVGDADVENLAVSGSTPADWLGYGDGRDLSGSLDDVVEADPDLTVLTIGANPLLERFLMPKGDRLCATLPLRSKVLECVRNALEEEELQKRLGDIYTKLLDTPEDGRNGLVVVFQYPETHPPSAFGVRVQVLIDELRETIDRAAEIVRETDPEKGARLVIADPGPFLEHGCTAGEPWILRVDTCIHPNVAGHKQLARVLDGLLATHHAAEGGTSAPVRPPGGPLTATSIGPAQIGMTQAEVEAVLTPPDRTAAGGQNWLWDYPNPGWLPSESLSGVGLTFVQGVLHSYSCSVPDCATTEGLAVGDPTEAMESVYGPRLTPHPDNELDLIVSAGEAGTFPALELPGFDAPRVIMIGGGYSSYQTGQASGVIADD